MKVGIVFLTADNVPSIWIHYESGTLAKTIDERARLCTYLLDDLKPKDIEPPLGHFQYTVTLNTGETKNLRRNQLQNIGGWFGDQRRPCSFGRIEPEEYTGLTERFAG